MGQIAWDEGFYRDAFFACGEPLCSRWIALFGVNAEFRDGLLRLAASNLPSRASFESFAATIDSGVDFQKWLRRCSRLSLRPKPSVPSETSRLSSHGASWSGTDFM